MAYTCYKVMNPQGLLNDVVPTHENVFAHHATHAFGVPNDSELPKSANKALVVGIASDEKGQAVVVAINGSSVRPDGKIYHITISCAEGVKPVYSNELISRGYKDVDTPFEIDIEPSIVNFK